MIINKSYALKDLFTSLMALLFSVSTIAQAVEQVSSDEEIRYAEMLAEHEEEMDIDDLIPELQARQKININDISAEELVATGLLTGIQVEAFIQHRKKFGKFISVYELQTIEGWDHHSIRKFLSALEPEIRTVKKQGIKERFTKGHSMLLLRYGSLLEKTSAAENDTAENKYLGGQGRLLFRYRYNYRGLIQYNFLAEKDPGEQLKFHGSGLFDFNSLNFSLNKPFYWCDQLVIGDYTISMGQGLIQWQGFGISKGAGSMNIKKQGPVLKSYGSSGENNFHRGVAARFAVKNIKALLFVSNKKIDANIENDTVRSILSSGLHRNNNENDDRKTLRLLAGGIQVISTIKKFNIGLNAVYYKFSKPLYKNFEPYNLYSIKGTSWNNFSLHYSRTIRNIHLFGEVAADKNFSIAHLHALILTLHKNVDLSFLYRNISSRYQAMYSRAFTENTTVNNEKGIYAAVSARFRKFRIDMHADQYYFPWLKYRVDAPSGGYEYALMLSWNPSKNIDWMLRYKYETKQLNEGNIFTGANTLKDISRFNYRTQLNWNYTKQLLFRFRMENNQFMNGMVVSRGSLAFAESHYRFINYPVTAVLRLQYFEADDFNSRVYAFENDVQYGFSVPFFTGKGWRYYITTRYKPSNQFLRKYLKNRDFHLSLKWSQSFFPFEKTNGSGPNLIFENKRSEIKLQLILERTG